ncbi:hypothetical protein DMC01_00355 [Campylobacter troglodytis]|nr:hypothetical protein DMC01_00355 [Campylobacter troglodytis]
MARVDVGLKMSVFLLRATRLVTLREGMLKRNRTSLYAQTLALQKNYYRLGTLIMPQTPQF